MLFRSGLEKAIGLRTDRDDDVIVLPGQLVREFPQPIRIALSPKIVDRNISADDQIVLDEVPILKGEQAGERPVRLYPESDTNFFIRTLNALVTFRKNMSGEVTGFVLDTEGFGGRLIGSDNPLDSFTRASRESKNTALLK